jgi:hypothetical protein
MGKDSLNFDPLQELPTGICGRKDMLMIGVDAAKRRHGKTKGTNRRCSPVLTRISPFESKKADRCRLLGF